MINHNHSKIIQRIAAASVLAALFTGCASHRGASGNSANYYSGTTYSTTTSSSCDDKGSKAQAQGAQGGSEQFAENSNSGENTVIPLYKEELRVGKRTVEAGSVRLHKTVKTETVNEPVQLREESITVEREPAGNNDSQSFSQSSQGQSGSLSEPFKEGDMEIRLQREEPVVEKRVVPAGRIVAQKRSQTEQRNISEQVRVDGIAVDRSGDSQNIVISQNLNGSGMGGSAESSSESSGRGASGHMITDIRNLSSEQASALDGQKVRLSHVQIEQSLGNNLISLRGGQQPIYVHLSQSQSRSFQPGQTISLSGTIHSQSQTSSQSELSPQEQQALRGQSFFIEADRIEAGER
jgi:uncharacterized protein (TIGR02271 family)